MNSCRHISSVRGDRQSRWRIHAAALVTLLCYGAANADRFYDIESHGLGDGYHVFDGWISTDDHGTAITGWMIGIAGPVPFSFSSHTHNAQLLGHGFVIGDDAITIDPGATTTTGFYDRDLGHASCIDCAWRLTYFEPGGASGYSYTDLADGDPREFAPFAVSFPPAVVATRAAPIPGDADDDGDVDLQDFNVLAANFGVSPPAEPDFDHDGDLDLDDFNILAANFGSSFGRESLGVLPEPGTLALLAAIGLFVSRRRQS